MGIGGIRNIGKVEYWSVGKMQFSGFLIPGYMMPDAGYLMNYRITKPDYRQASCKLPLFDEVSTIVGYKLFLFLFPIWELLFILSLSMRIISRKTIINFWKKNPDSEQALKSWFVEIKNAQWKSPNDLKQHFKNASIITNKRVVFKIKGNLYRLIVDIEYRIKIVFIVWIGNHKQYDKINAKEIKYDKTN